MAIGQSIRPLVIVTGYVERTRDLKRKADGKVYGVQVAVKQSNDALAVFTIYSGRDGSYPDLPPVGEFVAAECSVEESREFGSSLGFERPAFEALDAIQSVLSGKKAA